MKLRKLGYSFHLEDIWNDFLVIMSGDCQCLRILVLPIKYLQTNTTLWIPQGKKNKIHIHILILFAKLLTTQTKKNAIWEVLLSKLYIVCFDSNDCQSTKSCHYDAWSREYVGGLMLFGCQEQAGGSLHPHPSFSLLSASVNILPNASSPQKLFE